MICEVYMDSGFFIFASGGGVDSFGTCYELCVFHKVEQSKDAV